MCIDTKRVVTATKNIEVWKVFHKVEEELQSPFRCVTLSDMILEEAMWFNIGFGYCCFRSKENAKKYKKILAYHEVSNAERLKIIKLFIPKGNQYGIGKVEFGCHGEGIPAVRAERLIKK